LIYPFDLGSEVLMTKLGFWVETVNSPFRLFTHTHSLSLFGKPSI